MQLGSDGSDCLLLAHFELILTTHDRKAESLSLPFRVPGVQHCLTLDHQHLCCILAHSTQVPTCMVMAFTLTMTLMAHAVHIYFVCPSWTPEFIAFAQNTSTMEHDSET